MPTNRRYRVRRRDAARLTISQFWDLILGPTATRPDQRPNFATKAETRAAWFDHRDELMTDHVPGRRPWGWWKFEAPKPRDETMSQAAQLIALGVVGNQERREIEADWRRAEMRAGDTLA